MAKDFLLLPLPFGQLPLHFGVQAEGDTPLAVEIRYCYLVGEIRPDDPVQDCQTLLDGMLLKGVGRQYRHFFVRQVIDHIGSRLLGLYGQRPCLPIDDQAVRGKAFLPFLVGEIDRRGYQLLVGTRRFPAARTADQRRDGRLQVLQHVLLPGRRTGCPPL